MSTDRPLVSVVIPTRNQSQLLREAIESFKAQTLNACCFEVLVIDNCSTDATAQTVRQLQESMPFRLVYHRMPSNQGPPRSRNAGARMAQAPIVAFTDSDCRVSPQWLARGVEMFAARNGLAFVTGPVLDKPEQTPSFFTVGTALEGENPMYPTANIFYSARHFWEAGGFDEGTYLGDAGGWPVECADTDLAWQIKNRGGGAFFADDLIVYHELRKVTLWRWLAWTARMAQLPELFRRHPGLRKKLAWWGPFCLADNFWFYIALLGVVLAFLTLRPWFVLLAAPYVFRAAAFSRARLSPAKLAVMPARVFLLALRQSAICGFLIYGSIRARTLVL